LENFAREYPGKSFPDYRSVSAIEAEQTKLRISMQMDFPPSASSLELVRLVREQSTVLSNVNAESDDFNLKSVIFRAGIMPKEEIYINWHRFDEIDRMRLEDLSGYFEDIWYPSADDIDLFDDSLSWIFSISYSGNISYLRFK